MNSHLDRRRHGVTFVLTLLGPLMTVSISADHQPPVRYWGHIWPKLFDAQTANHVKCKNHASTQLAAVRFFSLSLNPFSRRQRSLFFCACGDTMRVQRVPSPTLEQLACRAQPCRLPDAAASPWGSLCDGSVRKLPARGAPVPIERREMMMMFTTICAGD